MVSGRIGRGDDVVSEKGIDGVGSDGVCRSGVNDLPLGPRGGSGVFGEMGDLSGGYFGRVGEISARGNYGHMVIPGSGVRQGSGYDRMVYEGGVYDGSDVVNERRGGSGKDGLTTGPGLDFFDFGEVSRSGGDHFGGVSDGQRVDVRSDGEIVGSHPVTQSVGYVVGPGHTAVGLDVAEASDFVTGSVL